MAAVAVGGGSSAVAASAHAGCTRFRSTDPIVTGRSRRRLAEELGFPDASGVIPEARWMRAMLFERLVHDKQFISELMTRGLGQLGLERPEGVRHMDCRRSERRTIRALNDAHQNAAADGVATMLTGTAVPMSGFEGRSATPVLPDFLIVARRPGVASGSWLIAGDAKDYERIRSRIDDGRLLKGFLQVALGAESIDRWTARPEGMIVHASGILAVPRSAYLRPEAVVERLDDHRAEVRGRLAERVAIAEGVVPEWNLADVAHLDAEFDPARCVTCSLFGYCRDGLRASSDPLDLLTEIGIARPHRAIGAVLLTEPGAEPALPEREVLNIRATVTGLAQRTRALRIDPVGQPATVNVVLVKSDAAALGVTGVAVQLVRDGGAEAWRERVFREPRTPETRTRILSMIGEAIDAVMDHSPDGRPVHVCVPDSSTADVLATMADSAAGVEISRLSWDRDLAQGRPALTFDGAPATIPTPLSEHARLAASFLLDEDRARALTLRSPVVVIQQVLARHLVPGGPWSDAGRLDYLVAWGDGDEPLDHREVSDVVSERVSAPGARMTTHRSNEVHTAEQVKDWVAYDELVLEELAFRKATVNRAIALLEEFGRSRLTAVHAAIESSAQAVWRRRLLFHASDLVRFSLTAPWWRDQLVPALEGDRGCARVLGAMLDTGTALDLARDAGNRQYFEVEVIGVAPLRLRSASRTLRGGMEVVVLHVEGEPEVERSEVVIKLQKGDFTFNGLASGPLLATEEPQEWLWDPVIGPGLEVGDEVVLANVAQIGRTVHVGTQLNIPRPSPDGVLAPKESCAAGDYDDDPHGHRNCCKSHEVSAAERADYFAERRARGEMNPEVWPPIVDVERFVVPGDEELGNGDARAIRELPDGATLDDIE